MTTLEILRAARAKIELPECWLGGEPCAAAEDENGRDVNVNDPKACKWCAFGALESFVTEPNQHRAWLAVTNQVTGMLSVWNDTRGRTHAEVLAAFDRAIASLS